jgi:hypothetical protein
MNGSAEFTTRLRTTFLLVLASFLLLVGCAHRPINPPITQADPKAGYRYLTRPQYTSGSESVVILAFSGGGTRAAAFSYGVLTERQQGTPARLCRRDHRRFGRKLYGARLRPLR